MTTGDCVFCKIIRGELPSEPLHRDGELVVIRDINPSAPVHLLIIPTEHLTSLERLDPKQIATMGSVFDIADKMAEETGVKDSGYRLVLNQGQDSGQLVAHAHVHLLGGRRLGALG